MPPSRGALGSRFGINHHLHIRVGGKQPVAEQPAMFHSSPRKAKFA
jgi:hypothetical protein